MNFNFSNQAEYTLNTNLTEEMINLYGVLTKYIITEKINKDDLVFGDYSHIKSDSTKIYDMYMLPEVSEDWDTSDYAFTQFGMTNFGNINLFISTKSLAPLNGETKMIGDLIVFPNNKVMEIVSADPTTPGINNLFTYDDAKSVITINCKPYDFKLINELDNVDISVDEEVPYETLDTYFQELVDIAEDQDDEAEVTAQVSTVVKNENTIDEIINKPIIDNTEDDVFGAF